MTMTVIKDCTGTYLRYNNKDHLVCNEDKLDIYENETIVSASILKDDNCYSDRAHCAALHRYEIAEGNFWVAKIKN